MRECRCGYQTPGDGWRRVDAPRGATLRQCPQCGDVYGDLGEAVDVGRAAIVLRNGVESRGGCDAVVVSSDGATATVFADGSLHASGEGAVAARLAARTADRLSAAGVLAGG